MAPSSLLCQTPCLYPPVPFSDALHPPKGRNRFGFARTDGFHFVREQQILAEFDSALRGLLQVSKNTAP